MKKLCYSLCVLSLLTLGACRNSYQGEVVKETYVHKYGVPVSLSDWARQGEDGQVVQLQKDGVTVIRSYAQGVQTGVTTWSFPNNDIVAKTQVFDSGRLVSECDHYPSGHPREERLFDEEGSLTQRLTWYEEGSPSAIETYENGFLSTGEYLSPSNSVDSVIMEGTGIATHRNNEGELLYQDRFEQGILCERTEFYSNGDPSAVTPFHNGKIAGQRKTYFRGGLPQAIEEWVSNHQQGTTCLFHNGEKVAEVPFVDGQKHGVERRYRDGQAVVEEVTWDHDVQHGPRKLYVDGEAKVEWYHHGEVVSRPTFERLNPPRIER